MSKDVQLLVSRIFLVILFFVSGLGMLAGPSGTAGYFGSLGIPLPGLVVWLVIAVKLIGGLCVLLGFKTRYAAWLLAAFCVGAALIGHHNFADQNDLTQFLKDLAITGGFLALAAAGPGALSLDARR